MSAPAREPNDAPFDGTEAASIAEQGVSAPTFLDSSDDNLFDVAPTNNSALPTPIDPLGLTIDFHPHPHPPAESPSIEPLTQTDVTRLASGKLSTDGSGRLSAAAVRHSVPGYEILRELGRGGMGVVYQARQKGLNRLVALKMILAGDHAGAGERDRFKMEAEAVAALQHPNIVQIFEIGEIDTRPYLAFEYIEGGTLAHHLAGNPWPARSAASLVEVLARAVQFAHDRGIVHRDLKPGNVLLNSERGIRNSDSKQDKQSVFVGDRSEFRIPSSAIPKITDFGLAKRVEKESDWSATGEVVPGAPGGHTRTGAVMGTPSYIAPEQAAGKNRDVGPPADIYALGAILYELLTGRPPFRGETPLDTVLQVMSDDPVPPRRLQPKVPRDLETICLRCLQKPTGKRYLTAGDLADDLRRFQANEPIEARPIGPRERLVKWATRHPAVATFMTISGLALVATLAISFYFNVALRKSAEDKENEAAKALEAQVRAERSAKEKDEQTRIANEQRQKADERLKQVEKAQKDAERAHQEALKREDQAKRSAYALALNRSLALVERDPTRAALLLDKREECPFDLRDFTWHYLRAMCRIDLGFLAGHTNTLSQVSWASEGKRIATSSWDGAIRIWNADGHQTLAVLRGHRGIVRGVLFAPDGRTLVSFGSDHRVLFWELPLHLADENGGRPVSLAPWGSADVGDVHSLAISPDGFRVAVGSADGKVRVLSLPTPQRTSLMGMAGGLASLVVRKPEVGATRDLGPALALPFKPHAQNVLNGHKGTVNALVWTKDGLFSGGQDRTVRHWTLGENPDNKIIFENTDEVLCIDVSNDGDHLAVASTSNDDASIRLWSMRLGHLVSRLRGHIRKVNCVTFSTDGKLLASASLDGTVRVWETAGGQERCVYRGHKAAVYSVAFAPDQSTVVSGGMDNLARIWTIAAANEQTVEIEARAPIAAAASSIDGRVLALADRDAPIMVWLGGPNGFGTRNSFTLRGAPGRATALAVGPHGESVAAILNSNDEWSVAFWKLPKNAAAKGPVDVKPERVFKAEGEMTSVACFGSLLAIGGKKGVQIWDIEKRAVVHTPTRLNVNSLAFTPDGEKLVTAGDQMLQVWEMATGREDHGIRYLGKNIASVAVGPMPDDDHANPKQVPSYTIITSDVSGSSLVWTLAHPTEGRDNKKQDSRRFQLTQRANLTGHAEPVTSVAFSSDGKTIATTSVDRTIRLWDPVTGRERSALTSHTDAVLLAAFMGGDTAMISVGREGALKIWHAPR